MNLIQDFKERCIRLRQKMSDYRDKAPERKEARYEKRKLSDERYLDQLTVKAKIEKKKSEISKEQTYRERAKMKLRKQKEKTGGNNNFFGRPMFSTDKKNKKDYSPFSLKGM